MAPQGALFISSKICPGSELLISRKTSREYIITTVEDGVRLETVGLTMMTDRADALKSIELLDQIPHTG